MAGVDPRVSIGLPVYNGEGHLRVTLDSLLAQTYDEFEIVISDNASTDSTQDICREYGDRDARIRYFRNEKNLGASPNFCRVFELARGEYFKWAGHDDTFEATLLEKAVPILDGDDSVVLCYWLETMVDGDGQVLRTYSADRRFEVDSSDAATRFAQLLWHERSGFQGDPVYGVIRSDALRTTDLVTPSFQTNWLLMQELSLVGAFFTIPEMLASRHYNAERSTAASLIRWLDSSRSKVGFPHFRVAGDYYRVASRSPHLDRGQRWRVYGEIAKYFSMPDRMRGYVWDLTKGRFA